MNDTRRVSASRTTRTHFASTILIRSDLTDRYRGLRMFSSIDQRAGPGIGSFAASPVTRMTSLRTRRYHIPLDEDHSR
jgi:hypothetical protein